MSQDDLTERVIEYRLFILYHIQRLTPVCDTSYGNQCLAHGAAAQPHECECGILQDFKALIVVCKRIYRPVSGKSKDSHDLNITLKAVGSRPNYIPDRSSQAVNHRLEKLHWINLSA